MLLFTKLETSQKIKLSERPPPQPLPRENQGEMPQAVTTSYYASRHTHSQHGKPDSRMEKRVTWKKRVILCKSWQVWQTYVPFPEGQKQL